MLSTQSMVWSVANTRWPVSAAAECGLHGLGVADLADEDHVRVLAERRAQRDEEVRGVETDLALADRGQLVMVEDLDRVLDRDDVALTGPVDVVDHGCQCRGLAGARRSRHEDQAALLVGEAADRLRQVQLAEGPGVRPHQPEDHADRARAACRR